MKNDLNVCIVKQADKMQVITAKRGMTIAECLKKADIDFDASQSPKELDLRLNMKPAKFNDKVTQNNSYITLALKVKGGVQELIDLYYEYFI